MPTADYQRQLSPCGKQPGQRQEATCQPQVLRPTWLYPGAGPQVDIGAYESVVRATRWQTMGDYGTLTRVTVILLSVTFAYRIEGIRGGGPGGIER